MAIKRKTWLNNLWEGFLYLFLGLMFAPGGYFMLVDLKDASVRAVAIVNGIPIPDLIIPIFAATIGAFLILSGLYSIASTLYRRIIKKSRQYRKLNI